MHVQKRLRVKCSGREVGGPESLPWACKSPQTDVGWRHRRLNQQYQSVYSRKKEISQEIINRFKSVARGLVAGSSVNLISRYAD